MLYFERMSNTFPGYEMSEKDIETTLRFLQTSGSKNATRQDAVKYLELKHSIAHAAAHKIVEDEQNGKIEEIVIVESDR